MRAAEYKYIKPKRPDYKTCAPPARTNAQIRCEHRPYKYLPYYNAVSSTPRHPSPSIQNDDCLFLTGRTQQVFELVRFGCIHAFPCNKTFLNCAVPNRGRSFDFDPLRVSAALSQSALDALSSFSSISREITCYFSSIALSPASGIPGNATS